MPSNHYRLERWAEEEWRQRSRIHRAFSMIVLALFVAICAARVLGYWGVE